MAFTQTNKVATKKIINTKDALMSAKLEKLQMEVTLLKKAAKVNGDLIPVSEVTPFVRLFLESTRNTFQRLHVSLSVSLAECSTPLQCNKAMAGAFNSALFNLAREAAEQKIEVGKITLDVPISGLSMWLKDPVARGPIPASVTVERLVEFINGTCEMVQYNLLTLPEALAPRLVGRPEDEIKIILQGAVENCLRLLSEGGASHERSDSAGSSKSMG